MSEWSCEAVAEVYADHTGKPMVRFCGKPATPWGMATLCEEHKQWHRETLALRERSIGRE